MARPPPSSGATDFNAELADGDPNMNTSPHNACFDENSHSLANMARIVTGDYGAVEQVDLPVQTPSLQGGVRRAGTAADGSDGGD